MKIEGNTIIFKSAPHNYFKEFMGYKPNTILKTKGEIKCQKK